MSQQRKLVGKECRFAWHVPSYHPDQDDVHYVKEQITITDEQGNITQFPKLTPVFNYKRPVWITKASKRNHKDKREWDDEENLNRIECTQSELRNTIARATDQHWSKDPIKKLLVSPYVYGADITASSLLKKDYMNKFPDMATPYSRCVFDTETDVNHGHEEIVMATLIFKNEIFLSVNEEFLEGLGDVEEKLHKAVEKYIGHYVDKHKMKVTFHLAKNVVDLIRACFAKVHKWKPDWLVIWNMKFDIPKVLDMLAKYDVDPRTVLCDPDIPMEHRICKFIAGPDKQTTASGKVKPINPAAQWHTFRCTASYYVIDAMCAYKHLRLGEQEESSYALDAILNKWLDTGKLNFPEADHIEGKLAWHKFMQEKYKVEYMVYNIFDCLALIELDDKTKDLGYTLPAFAATTDFNNFKSNPRKIMDELHYYALSEGAVMGTVGYEENIPMIELDSDNDLDSDDDDEEEDEENTAAIYDAENDEESDEEPVPRQRSTLSLKNWILTLPAHMSVLGLPLILEDQSMRTGFRTHVYDSDEVAAYPTATGVANVSRSTTKRKVIDIPGIKETTFRMQNLNLLLGPVNATEYCTTMFNFPKPDVLLDHFLRDHHR